MNELAESLSISPTHSMTLVLLGILWVAVVALYMLDRFKGCKWEDDHGLSGYTRVTYYTECHAAFMLQYSDASAPDKCPYCGRKVKLS